MDLHEIEKVCDSIGGISTVKITTVDNITASYNPEIIDEDKVFSIHFRRKTGSYNEESEDSKAGQKIVQRLEIFVPKRRLSMELMIQKILNKRVVVIYEDHDGTGGLLYKAKFKYKYYTGKAKAEDQGYMCEFTTEKIVGSLDYSGVNIVLPEPGIPFENPNPGAHHDSCCVVVNPEPIEFIPAKSGNATYLNKYVVAPNGVKYFIDKFGNSMAFPMMPQYRQSWTGITGDEITVTNGELPSVDPEMKMFLFLNGDQQMYLPSPPLDEGQITTAGQKIKFSRTLEATDRVELYWIPNY